jgi:hypothetical protein
MTLPELAQLPVSTLKKHRDDLMSIVSNLDQAIKILEGNPEKPIHWKKSALDCLFDNAHPMRTVDILNCMFNKKDPIEPSDPIKRRNYVAALSLALNSLCDQGHLDRLQWPRTKGFFYGIKNWFADDSILSANYQKALENAWVNPYSVFRFSKKDKDVEV